MAPASAFERLLKQVWEEVLGVKQVGPRDNFFDLGGHSLLAFRLVSRIEQLFQLDLSLRTIFEAPVFGDYVAAILEQVDDRDRIEQIARILLGQEGQSAL